MSLTSDQVQPVQDVNSVNQFFDTEFDAPSMGTEQELSGIRITRKKDAGRRIGEVLKNGKVLVIVTTDMVHGELDNGYLECTLELITTPAEGTDRDGWLSRVAAIDMVVSQLELAAKRDGTGGDLRNIELDAAHKVRIFNADHRVVKAESFGEAKVTGTDRQGTLGIPADYLLNPFAPTHSNQPISQGFPAPRWYLAEAVKRAPAHSSKSGAQVYALIESAIQEFLRILNPHSAAKATLVAAGKAAETAREAETLFADIKVMKPSSPEVLIKAEQLSLMARIGEMETLMSARESMLQLTVSPDWKNSWLPLPRTPVVALLDLLEKAEATRIRDALQALILPNVDPHVLAWAKKHILAGDSLGGHFIPTPTIEHRRGFLVEYRSSVPEFFRDKFYYTENERGIQQLVVGDNKQNAK